MKYLIQKRAVLGTSWTAIPGQVVEDPPGVDILLSRGFLTPVSGDYPGEVVGPRSSSSSPPAPEGSNEISYPDLQAKAKALGIPANQKRPALSAAIAAAETAGAPVSSDQARERLEAMTEDELVAEAHLAKIAVTNRQETITAILRASGYAGG